MVKLVGILNITPDSFSDGGKFLDPSAAIQQAEQLFDDGASLIDIGAESTRPNAVALSDEVEWRRLELVMKAVLKRWPDKISLDTYHPNTVRRAFAIGPVIVNDVTGMKNPEMIDLVAKLRATCIISHLPGTNIQQAHQVVTASTVDMVKKDLLAQAQLLLDKGLRQDQVILDPGIGFGKTMELNHQLLRFAEEVPSWQVMIGYSRKRFLGDQRMDAATNVAAGKIAAEAGATYLRVHDVKAHHILL